MFSPEKSSWSGWLLTPKRNQNGSGASNPRDGEMGRDKGKGLAFLDAPTSPRNFSAEKYANMDKETLCDKISKLQNELFEYQYNMGLLLIEKKDWTSKYEALRQALAEVDDAYKREQVAHLSALSEVEKREENLRKALGIEKQCVNDLEKSLKEMRSEHAEIKFTADSKLAEARSLVTSVEEKSLEVEAKLHAVDARLAEVSRKNAEIERKSEDLAAQENALRRSWSSFTSEREAHEMAILKEKEDLQEWEQKLREGEGRHAEARSLLNQREQRVNENDKNLKLKEKELEDAQKKIDADKSALNKEEEDISIRLSNLVSIEKEGDSKKKSLEMKERQLNELEEKLNNREKVEMQKLLDEHKAILEAKEKEFELEIEQKTKSVDENLKNKVVEVEKKEAELKHSEEKIHKREQTIEKKSDKVKERENELELKLKALKERDKSLKTEEKKLEIERKKVRDDIENLVALKTELEEMRSDIELEKVKISEEREQLKVTEDERSEYARLQLELKHEIDKCHLQTEQLVKESENLKQERLRFEKEWEELDERSTKVKEEFAALNEEREYFEKLKLSEEEKLNNEKLQTSKYVQEELDALKMAKDSFAATMEHEKSVLAEKTQIEERKLLHDFELRKREFDVEILRKQEEMDNNLREKEKRFEEEKEKELKNINHLREMAYKETEEMKMERIAVEKEKTEILTNKQHLEAQQIEIREDIDQLVSLSQKLKDQREVFIKEKDRFCMFVEKLKSCNTCAELIHEFELSDLQSLKEIDNQVPLLPKIRDNYLKEAVHDTSVRAQSELSPNVVNFGSPNGTGKMSWLRKCTTTIFRLSPGTKDRTDGAHETSNIANADLMAGIEQELSFSIADDSLDAQVSHSDNIIREIEDSKPESDDDQRSQHSNAKARQRRPAKRGRPRSNRSGEDIVADTSKYVNGNTKDPGDGLEEGRDESGVRKNMKKRTRAHASQETSEHDGGENSGQTDSLAGQKKRRQKNVQMPIVSGESRYNFRRPRAAAVSGKNVQSGPTNNNKEKDDVNGHRNLEEENSELKVADDDFSIREIHTSVADVDFSTDIHVMFNNGGLAPEKEGSDGISGELVGEIRDTTSEEVNGTPERDGNEAGEDEEEEEEEEMEQPGEASVGKKLWKFLTT